MFRKIVLAATTATIVLALVAPAGAADRKLSGRFVTSLPSGVPSGTMEMNLQKDGSYDYRVRLNHVEAAGTSIAVTIDMNGNGKLDIEEAVTPGMVIACDLTPTKAHKASCHGNVVLSATPLLGTLRLPFAGSYLQAAYANLK